MITFKNRFAEFDNLDDSHNENALRNCYFREFTKNFNNYKYNPHVNLRYSKPNYNDIRLNDLRNRNNMINSQRQNAYTPYNRLSLNNNINNFNNFQNDNIFQRQNNDILRSSPNYSKSIDYNHISTPIPSFNNNNFNNNNQNGFNNRDNSFNNSNDNIQIFNENENIYNNNSNGNYDYEYSTINDINLNNSNDYQYEQEQEMEYQNDEIKNEIEKERQKQILLEQQRLNLIESELQELRLKRNIELKRKLEEKKINQKMYSKVKHREIEEIKIIIITI